MSMTDEDKRQYLSNLMSSVVQGTPDDMKFYNDMIVVAGAASKVLSALVYKCDVHFIKEKHHISTAAQISLGAKPIIVFNIGFFRSTMMRDLKFATLVLLHEIEHLFFKHTELAKKIFDSIPDKTDKKVAKMISDCWARAIDYSVNQGILSLTKQDYRGVVQEERIKRYLGYSDKISLLCSDQFVGKGVHEIFNTLLKNERDDKTLKIKSSSLPFQRHNKDVVLFDGDISDIDMDGQFDHHVGGLMLDEDGNLILDEGDGEGDIYIQQAIRSVYEQLKSMGSGLSPHDKTLLDYIREDMKPQVQWYDKFIGVVSNLSKNRQSYRRWNAVSTGGIIRTVRIGQRFRIVFGIDSSVSMSHDKDIMEGFQEFKGLIEQYDSWDIIFMTCDSSAHIISQYTSTEHTFDDVDFEIVGGGGTDMSPMVDMAQTECVDLLDDVDGIVIFTDGYIPTAPIEAVYQNRVPLIFVVTSEGKKDLEFTNPDIEIIHID